MGESIFILVGLCFAPIWAWGGESSAEFETNWPQWRGPRGFRGNALQAVRLSAAKGDISATNAIVWTLDRDTPYTPSPLLYDDMVYFLKGNDGVLSCYDASSGEEHFSRQRLEGIKGIYASPVGADGRVYIASRNGSTQVIKRGAQYEVLAMNTLDDGFSASPVIVGNEIFLRGHDNLYCIAEK